LWRGKEIAISYVYGSWEGSYALLPRLLNALVSSNPGSEARIESTALPIASNPGERLFKRAFWAFAPCIQAFPHLRPVISIDASWLRGRYDGRFLVAVGYDAENQLVPLAFGIVEKESKNNWGWFLKLLRDRVIRSDQKMCVISDRAEGIKAVFRSPMYGMNESAGEAVHRLCAQHVAENMVKRCRNPPAAEMFKKTCRKNSEWKFRSYLNELEEWHKESREYLNTVGMDEVPENEGHTDRVWAPQTWSLRHDRGMRWGVMTSNGSESLHKVFIEARGRPVCALVLATYYKMLEWFNQRKLLARELANMNQIFSNRVTHILEKRANKAAPLEVDITDIDGGVYSVRARNERLTTTGRRDRIYEVVVNQGRQAKCKCNKPQNTRIACPHVLTVCAMRNYDAIEFTEPLYRVDKLCDTWSSIFKVFGDEEDWEEYNGPKIIPDRGLIKKGRRKEKRYEMTMIVMEGRVGPRHCTICGTINHTTDKHPQANRRAGSLLFSCFN
jgi:hypothetical protein